MLKGHLRFCQKRCLLLFRVSQNFGQMFFKVFERSIVFKNKDCDVSYFLFKVFERFSR